MLKVIYCNDGEPISDFEVYEIVDDAIKINEKFPSTIINFKTSNELCLLTFSLRVLEGKIPIDKVEFYFENEKLEFDPVLGLKDPDDKTIGLYTEVCSKALKVGYEKILKQKGTIK